MSSSLSRAEVVAMAKDVRNCSTVMALAGVPLLVVRTRAGLEHLEQDAKLDNQAATWLMIDPRNGFAPPPWQCNIGEVTLVRLDFLPFTRAHFYLAHDYVADLLEVFGDGDDDDNDDDDDDDDEDVGAATSVPEEEASSAFLRKQMRINDFAPRRCRHYYSPRCFREWREDRYAGDPRLLLPWTRRDFTE